MKELEKVVAQARIKNNYSSKTQLKKLPLSNYSNFKRKDINFEIDRQFNLINERHKIKYFTDPLIKNKNQRKNKIFQKYISYAEFVGNYYDRNQGDMRFVSDYDPKQRMALVRVEGWINYSRRYGTYRKMAGLVLFDRDSKEYRFLRVSPNIETTEDALEYIKPAAVKKAEAKGKKVIRQGDVYFIPSKKWNIYGLGNHRPEKTENGIIVKHPTHAPIFLDKPHKAIQQIVVKNTHFRNGGGRIAGQAD